jgi:hypothetical protein
MKIGKFDQLIAYPNPRQVIAPATNAAKNIQNEWIISQLKNISIFPLARFCLTTNSRYNMPVINETIGPVRVISMILDTVHKRDSTPQGNMTS